MAVRLALLVSLCVVDLRVFVVALVACLVDGAVADVGVSGHCGSKVILGNMKEVLLSQLRTYLR